MYVYTYFGIGAEGLRLHTTMQAVALNSGMQAAQSPACPEASSPHLCSIRIVPRQSLYTKYMCIYIYTLYMDIDTHIQFLSSRFKLKPLPATSTPNSETSSQALRTPK